MGTSGSVEEFGRSRGKVCIWGAGRSAGAGDGDRGWWVCGEFFIWKKQYWETKNSLVKVGVGRKSTVPGLGQVARI